MAVYRAPLPADGYTQIRNEWCRDRRIVGNAFSLLAYISSHKVGYELTTQQIERQLGLGTAARRAAIKKLEACGYLERIQKRNDDGTMGEVDYRTSDPFGPDGKPAGQDRGAVTAPRSPEGQNRRSEPECSYPPPVDPPPGEPGAVRNTPFKKTMSEKTTRENTTTPSDADASGGQGTIPGIEAEEPKPTAKAKRGRSVATPLPDDWEVTRLLEEWALEKGIRNPGWLAHHTERFRLHAQANGRKQKDWDASWKNWILVEIERKGLPPAAGSVVPIRPNSPTTGPTYGTRRSPAETRMDGHLAVIRALEMEQAQNGVDYQ